MLVPVDMTTAVVSHDGLRSHGTSEPTLAELQQTQDVARTPFGNAWSYVRSCLPSGGGLEPRSVLMRVVKGSRPAAPGSGSDALRRR